MAFASEKKTAAVFGVNPKICLIVKNMEWDPCFCIAKNIVNNNNLVALKEYLFLKKYDMFAYDYDDEYSDGNIYDLNDAFELAVNKNYYKIVKYLYENEASRIDIQKQFKEKCILEICIMNDYTKMFKYLFQIGINNAGCINASFQNELFEKACDFSNWDIVQYLQDVLEDDN